MDDDNDALELLNQLLSTPLQPMYYFYYDPPTGKIVHVRNYLEVDEYPYLEYPQTNFESNISLNEYQVIDTDGKKQLVKKDKPIIIAKIDDNIHQIHKMLYDPDIKISQMNYRFDLLIEQDNIKKEFRIRLSGLIKDQYHQGLISKQQIACYVTAENDPNILYKRLDIPLAKLLQYHYYTIPYDDYDSIPCNIFSMRYFHNYLHLVIE